MAKTRQILKFCDYGKEYKVVKVIGDYDNPYRIYHIYRDYNQYHYITEHKKLVGQFSCLGECFKWFYLNV